MRRYLPLLLFIGLAWGQVNKKKNLLDGVKLEKQIHYKYKDKFGERIEHIINEMEISYNTKGDTLYKLFDDGDRIVYKYDNKGNLIDKSSFSKYEFYIGGKIKVKIGSIYLDYIEVCRVIYKYDSKGNLIEMSYYDDDGSLSDLSTAFLASKLIYKYDKNNNLIENSNYYWNGLLESKEIYSYNSDGKISEIIQINEHYFGDGWTDTTKIEYKFDSKGNVINEITGGSVVQDIRYKYDSKNNIIEETDYRNGILAWKHTFEYDSNNRMIVRKLFDKNQMIFHQIFKYDFNGNLVEEFDEDLTYKRQYKYDNHSRIIEKLYFDYDYSFGKEKEKLVKKITIDYE